MISCVSPDIGQLLTDYEFGLLSESESEQFELHLMSCSSCFSKVQSCAHVSETLRRDPEVRKHMADLVREINLASAKSTSTIEALLNFLFTSRNADWGVRPVAVVTSMLVVCFLTVLGSRWISGTGDSSGQLYLISLDEKLTRGLDGELTFPAGLPSAFSIALPSFQNQSGALTIVRRADSQEVYRLKPLVLDSKGTAVVSLGPKVLVPGAYIARVTVVDRHNREVIYEYLLSCVEK